MFELKTHAFTLFESVIAITIITICLGIGTLIYTNVLRAENTLVTLEGQFEIEKIVEEVKIDKFYFSKQYNYDNYQILQKVKQHSGKDKLYQISFDLIVNNKKTYNRQYLIYDPES